MLRIRIRIFSIPDPGSKRFRIPDPDPHQRILSIFHPSRIPDPGVEKSPDPGSRGRKVTGSRIRIRNTGFQSHFPKDLTREIQSINSQQRVGGTWEVLSCLADRVEFGCPAAYSDHDTWSWCAQHGSSHGEPERWSATVFSANKNNPVKMFPKLTQSWGYGYRRSITEYFGPGSDKCLSAWKLYCILNNGDY